MLFPKGTAIAYSIIPVIKQLDEPLRTEVKVAFADSLRFVWVVSAAVAGAGFLSSLMMKSIPLNSTLDDQWGLKEEDGVNHELA